MLNRNRNVETFLGCENTYEESRIVLYGAPFDSTTSYRPGTRFASRTMRAESYGLETYSPYQDLDLEDAKVFDGGDLELVKIEGKVVYLKLVGHCGSCPFAMMTLKQGIEAGLQEIDPEITVERVEA